MLSQMIFMMNYCKVGFSVIFPGKLVCSLLEGTVRIITTVLSMKYFYKNLMSISITTGP